MTKPQTLKGFRDFLPAEKRRRDFVASKIRAAFELFGFEPLETPTLEYAEVIMGKYGEEADKLVYKFTDNGEREVAMRYDQTVPTARVLIQYQNELPKFFRRFQMQTVFRAEKPQKGRFREFAQCDIDIFGSSDALADAEVLACIYAAYKNVGFSEIILKVNDRQVLMNTLQQYATDNVSVFSIVQSVDKLDKLTPEQVTAELVAKGLGEQAAQTALEEIQKATPSEALNKIIQRARDLGVPADALEFTPSLARGLDYYTGMIVEVVSPQYGAGSLGGGGRYDNLIRQLGGPDIPAVGFAVGFDRTVEAAVELGLIPQSETGLKVLVTVFSPELADESARIASKLREAGIATELYPDSDGKIGKQLGYASDRGAEYVVILGPDEVAKGEVVIKRLADSRQETVLAAEIGDYFAD